MKTDVNLYRRTKNVLICAMVLCAVFITIGFVLKDQTMLMTSSTFLFLFALILLVNVMEYRHHVVLLKRHAYQHPQEIVEWLVSASARDRGAFVDFLDDSSVKTILDHLELYMKEYPEKDLFGIYREIRGKL